jgi:hypothetical protein
VITAVDTNVLLDIFTADPRFGVGSRASLAACLQQGSLVADEIVWAETAAAFPGRPPFERAIQTLGVVFDPLTARTALEAGAAWRLYRQAGGTRRRVLADFIGAHATHQADRLLTRDRGFYRTYFPRLQIVDPAG